MSPIFISKINNVLYENRKVSRTVKKAFAVTITIVMLLTVLWGCDYTKTVDDSQIPKISNDNETFQSNNESKTSFGISVNEKYLIDDNFTDDDTLRNDAVSKYDEISQDGEISQSKLLKEGKIKGVRVTSVPAGYEYSFNGSDVNPIVEYLVNLNLISDFEETPDEYMGMTWVIILEYEGEDTLTIYHFGNMFIKTNNGPWYKMTYEEASGFDLLLFELRSS